MFSCLKGAEDGDGFVLRVFNPRSELVTARVLGPVTVDSLRLDESGGSPVPDSGIRVGAGEITTLRLTPAPAPD